MTVSRAASTAGSDALCGVTEQVLAAFRKVDDPARMTEMRAHGPFWDVILIFVPARV
jgi:hypothetical protein